jgi:hypothetical protein
MKKFIIVFLVLVISSSACVKLKEVPMSSLSPENFYTTPAQVESAFAASMNCVWGYWYGYGVGMQAYTNMFVNDDQIYGGNLVLDNYAGNDFWGYHYKALLNVNTALHSVLTGKVQNTPQDQLDLLIGQAKFLRAYNYFMLVRLFGAVPLYLDGDDPISKPKARTSVDSVYNQIVSDLKDAAVKLPDTWPSDMQGRPSSGAAYGMLAKVYITMATAPLNKPENYALAAAAAKKVMDAGIFSLVPAIEDVFKYENKYGPEMMWSYTSTSDDIATDGQSWTGAEAPYYGWGDITADDSFALSYPNQARKDAYFVLYNDAGDYYLTWQNAAKRAGIKKYLNGPISELNAYSMTNNIPILRYADVLLLFAEAENMSKGGPTQDAVDAINQIINRANGSSGSEPLATLSMSMAAFDKKVIQERSWELCYEFDRWFDTARKRILKEATQATQPWILANYTDNDYLFPIPLVDLRLNKLLVQNPGY